MQNDDTIAAVATAPGQAGIAIIRVSGPASAEIYNSLFRPRREGPIESHRLRYGHIIDPKTGEAVDEALVAYMAAPSTYTRQDVLEISCHGGPATLRAVLDLVLGCGARPAGPGEFTMRAFVNGRVDLSQAEAALDIIRARTSEAARIAVRQLGGAVSAKVSSIRDILLRTCAHVEAHIDFPEDEIEPSSLAGIREGIEAAAREVRELMRTFSTGRYFRDGLRVAIVGRPNVGKSSLLNALLRDSRAIVTETPGTTRDVIEEELDVNGLPVRIMDTAGIRESHDMVEREGVRRSLAALRDADMALAVFDGSAAPHPEDLRVMDEIKGVRAIAVMNKSDLPGSAGYETGGLPEVSVSCRTGEGLDGLLKAIYQLATEGGASARDAEGVVITNARHRDALEKSLTPLGAASASLGREPLEITAMELRDALMHLQSIIGTAGVEDMLGLIFSEFCIGK